jgi:hypothetical protein
MERPRSQHRKNIRHTDNSANIKHMRGSSYGLLFLARRVPVTILATPALIAPKGFLPPALKGDAGRAC